MKNAATLYVRADSGDMELLDQERNRELWTGSFVVEPPNGDATAKFVLLAEAFDKNKELLGSGRLKTGFVSGQTRYAHLTLSACKKVVEAELSPADLVPRATLANAVMAQCQPDEESGKGGSGGGGSAGISVGSAGTSGRDAGQPHAADDEDGGKPASDTCGDGLLNDEELCDIRIARGQLGACPSSCSSSDACSQGRLIGTGCQAHCEYEKIKDAIRNDGCCPKGASANSDNDCKAQCGNGVIEGAETCDPPSSCPTATLCDAAAPTCTTAELKGSPDQCMVTCEVQPLTDCKSGDGCCPDHCTQDNDDDCPTMCGDGHVDAEHGETCEPSSPTQACPKSCADSDPCTDDITTGSPATCNVRCEHIRHLTPRNSDNCCPSGANANNDNDCSPVCPNGVVESGELCDGDCPTNAAACDDGDSCTTDMFLGSDCQRRCTHTERAASTTSDGCCPKGVSESVDPDCVNLLKGRVFVASVDPSTSEPNHPVSWITDDNDNTRWISLPRSPVTLTVDLGASHTLRQIKIIWAGDTIRNFSLEISPNNVDWTSIYTGVTMNMQIEPESYETFSANPTGRYFRIIGRDRWKSSYGNSIFEVRLYGN